MVKGIITKKLDAKFLIMVFDFAGWAFLKSEKCSEFLQATSFRKPRTQLPQPVIYTRLTISYME